MEGRAREDGSKYVEIDVEVATAAEFPVADLECDGHLVVTVKFFVEAFSGVGFELDVVGESGGEERETSEAANCPGGEHDADGVEKEEEEVRPSETCD